MSAKYEKLKTLLRELFQLEQPDLDFGIYRIMHARSAEIGKFLDDELLPQVKASFAAYQPADKAAIQAELENARAQAQALGADPETLPKVKELRARLTNEAVDITTLEGEVYDHLFSFFRRYYSEGDFISKRVYKEGVYAIPYEGEEVKLHWANSDQYYIKTSEYLRDYAFRLQPDNPSDQMRVHFRLVDAAEGEHGNVKEAEGKTRVFVLAAGEFIGVENGELVIKFEYRPATLMDWLEADREGKSKPPTQKDLLTNAERRILTATGTGLSRWIDLLGGKHRLASGEQADYTRLAAHLNRYTARNTFDYFIHKDLRGFLKRELDFYIKNEVMHLDDVENESAPRVEQYLSKIKVIRKIATKIIDFLAQLENFQKKLWLKKKFVVETNYCITLDRIPEEFYPEIAANDAQREEWVKLYAINTLSSRLGDLLAPSIPRYSIPLSIEFLKANNKLMVDTKLFSTTFSNRLISSIEDLDSQCDGLLIHSENFQALSLLQNRYNEQIACVYIDPPYNTAASAICYKNEYKSSSWLTLMHDRIVLGRHIISKNGVLIAAIDDFQFKELSFLIEQDFHEILGTFAVRSNPSGRPTQTGYAVSHEYMIAAGVTSASAIGRLQATDDQAARFSEHDEQGVFEWRNLRREGSNSDRSARRALYYPIFVKDGLTARVPKMEWQEETKEWILLEQPGSNEIVVFPNNDDGKEKTWRWEGKKVESCKDSIAVRKDRSGKDYIYYKRRPNEDGVVAVSSWFDAKYSSVEHGTALLKDIMGTNVFSYPKSIHTVQDSIYISGAIARDAFVLDYFAGSGTTGHAVINLNRADQGNRKYLLVEMGDYFDTVLKPRIEKVVYSDSWKDGEPIACDSGISHCFKYIRLESYEDTLNNLELKRTSEQQTLLDLAESKGEGKLKEDYTLHYMLDIESRGSPSLLSIDRFIDPTAYKLKVKKPGSDESREVAVDLIETFNYLIGLKVSHISAPHVLTAEFERDSENRLRIKGRLRNSDPQITQRGADQEEKSYSPNLRKSATSADPSSWWFRNVTGTLLDGRRILIIWRKRPGGETPEGLEQDNLVLDEWFKSKQGYSTKDSEFDLIYVNGTNNLENLKTPDDLWKVRLIEEDFLRLMFEDTEA